MGLTEVIVISVLANIIAMLIIQGGNKISPE